MKKKCRLYKPNQMQEGGQSNDKVNITQDSQLDPIPQERNNNFLSWLRKTTQEKKLEEELEERFEKDTRFGMQRDIKSQKGNQVYQAGGPTFAPGVQGNDYLEKEDVNSQFFQASYNRSNPNIMDNLQMFTQGMQGEDPMIMAQDGISYPGTLPLLPEVDELTLEKMNQLINQDPADVFDPSQYKNAPINEFEPGSPEDPFNKKKEKKDGAYGSIGMDPRNTNMAQGIVAGMRVGEGFFNFRNRAEQEKELKNRFSNVFETHSVASQDRGDYMVNTPGIGDPLKPDEHTRMGYNTKVAQDGLQIDQEVELTEEEINDLIAQGYNLEYLD